METTGKLIDVALFQEGYKLTFQTQYIDKEECNKLLNIDELSIKAVKRTKKRSLDANAYFHVLVGKIAEKLTISKAKSKNLLICRYGQPEMLPDGGIVTYTTLAPVEYMQELEYIHCTPIAFDDDWVTYKVYRGSHTYNTAEMSYLIDGTVADAKELGIETMTPAELKMMKERWGV